MNKSNGNSSKNRPPAGRNKISIGVALFALVAILLVQWTKGDLGSLLGGAAAPVPIEATIEQSQAEVLEVSPTAEESATAKATAAPKTSGSQQEQATVTPRPTKTPKGAGQSQAQPTKTARPSATPTPTANAPPVERASDLPTIAYADLPAEAQETVGLIDDGGPFPYSRDGIVFQNRERILPRHPDGYYHEYTVITPGSSDRGARRIITGESAEMYYTDDHYESFSEVMR